MEVPYVKHNLSITHVADVPFKSEKFPSATQKNLESSVIPLKLCSEELGYEGKSIISGSQP